MPRDRTVREAERFCREILPDVSRTFALSIRCLPGELGRAVLTGYLLCRIADTIEDAPAASVAQKHALFQAFVRCFDDATLADRYPQAAATLGETPGSATNDLRLTRYSDRVFQLYRSLSPGARAPIREWVLEMVGGMQSFVERYPNGVRIQTVDEYREYCYYVAGTVGHLLTELWRELAPGIGRRTYAALVERCVSFGEALQTVNILKDIALDAERENSIYIPSDALAAHGSGHGTLLSPEHTVHNRAALRTVMELAEHGLRDAVEYVALLPRRALPVRIFCALPVLLAVATMRDLSTSTAMLRAGGAVKISRAEVQALMVLGPPAAASNRAFRGLIDRVRRGPIGGGGGASALATS